MQSISTPKYEMKDTVLPLRRQQSLSPAMASRSSWEKSSGRNRCFQCKGRLKCGNQHILCQYMSMLMTWQKIKSRSVVPPVQIQTQSSPSMANTKRAAPYKTPMNYLSPNPPHAPESLNVQDLELMMQWCTTTYRSISINNNVERIWQTIVPREAMHHQFLMHGILAISALHLASSSGGAVQESYVKTSRAHQQKAIVGFTKVIQNLDQSNCNAAFALSSIMSILALAFPLLTGPVPGNATLDDLCQVFQLMKGSMDVLHETVDLVQNGELSPLLERDEPRTNMPDMSRLAIMSISMINADLASRQPQHEKSVYETTINDLSNALQKMAQGADAAVVAFQWICRIPSRFIDLVGERQPFALVILAHYAVILHSLKDYWWIGNWGSLVIREIGENLDPEWRRSMSWVMDATGCYIPPA